MGGDKQKGERRTQILQAIAAMLEEPGAEKITTAALAARLQVSEAALYRHFPGKAQMFDGLIAFIETSLFSLINQVMNQEEEGLVQIELILANLLRFAAKNHGLTRILTGWALVHEHPRLQIRVNQLLARLEATIKQALRLAAARGQIAPERDVAAQAQMLMSFVLGRWQQFSQGGFKGALLEHWPAQWLILQGQVTAEGSPDERRLASD
jgi:TetR/AcrR family transcriptional regulator